MNRFRIIEVKKGDEHYYKVEYLFKLLWIIPIWIFIANPKSFSGEGYFITYPSALEFIKQLISDKKETIHNFN